MAMADLAKYGGNGAVSLPAIAERQHLSTAYLEQLFLQLRRAGLVESTRGRAGGYKLGRPAVDIHIGDIMEAVEEPTRMTRCLGESRPGCVPVGRCLTHGLWDALGEHIRDFLAGVSLQDVLDGALDKRPRSPRPPHTTSRSIRIE
jgi:Rrf2 family transcriptional regulator, iron-sulfur cluster assembly transcription factor